MEMNPLKSRPAELSIRTPNGDKQVVTLEDDRYELGRADSNTLCFRDVLGVSRQHLVFERQGANWLVRDVGSTNGTFVNGTRITAAQTLRPKDRLKVGELSIVFDEGQAPRLASQTVMFVDERTAPATTTAEATLDNVLSSSQEIQGVKHMKALIDAGRELAGHTPLDKLFELILDLSMDAVGASRGVLMTLEEGDVPGRAASKGAGSASVRMCGIW